MPRRLVGKERELAVMAHDIKGPLASIVSMLGVINKGYVSDVDKIKDMVSRAHWKAVMLTRMVDDILDYALLENRSEIKMERIDFSSLLDASVEMLKPFAVERKIDIVHCASCQPGRFVYGNYTFLLRVFNNLIMNAIKYNKPNGKIHFGFDENNEKRTVSISVIDTGIGIPEEDLRKVFRIFKRGTQARKNVDGSIGLGLSLVKRIVEEHNGSIGINSKEGTGTTITVTLPLVK